MQMKIKILDGKSEFHMKLLINAIKSTSLSCECKKINSFIQKWKA